MLLVSKDKSQYNTAMIPSSDPNYYVIDNPNLEDKVIRGFPNIDFVFDEHEEIVDIIYTVQPPKTLPEQVQSLTEENQMLVDCILEMSEIIYGGE